MVNSSQVDVWISKAPMLCAPLDENTEALTRYVREGETLLAKLPAKPERSENEGRFAEQIFASCRRVRNKFIHKHAEEVYTILTEGLSKYKRLSELVFSAAERFPGLVPTRVQIEMEQGYIQAHKEGLEIDQGIFFRGLLCSTRVGSHLADAMLLPCPRALGLLDELRRTDKVNLGLILFERCKDAAYLTINNQSSLNAENNRLIDDMETAVDLALLDERVKVGVLRGGVMTHPRYLNKRVFCAGINLADLHGGKISFVDFLLGREFGYISKIVHGLLIDTSLEALSARTIQKPWVGAVDSFAIGGGMQLLLVLDKVIAADDAYFVLPAAQEGIVPGAANFRLSRNMGSRFTRQIILSGHKILATDPKAQWLCDEVVPAAKIDACIDAAVRELNNPAIIENRRMLSFAQEPRDRFREYMAEFAYVQATRLYSPDVLAKIGRWARSRETGYKAQAKYQCS